MSEYWTEEDLARLDAVLASGEQSHQYEDRKTVYRGLQELLELRARMKASLAGTQQGGMRIVYGRFGKGL